jgi:predicted O-linked N-acetylglucosamine transferase (SPINDLY family)
MRVLARVPGSVLWLYESNAGARQHLEGEARLRGIEPSRLRFGRTLPRVEHLARLSRADLFLDTLYINAHTGASDALWAGLPLLTCPQQSFASRVAASVLAAAELPQLICQDLADYEEKAVRLAREADELRSMRHHLENRRASLPLFDTARFACNLERAYEMVWQRHLSGQPPAPIEVTED